MRRSGWLQWAAERGKDVLSDEEIPKEVPKPYTVPEGWKPPTLGEQFRYVGATASGTPLPWPWDRPVTVTPVPAPVLPLQS